MALLLAAWASPAFATASVRRSVTLIELLMAKDEGLRILANGFADATGLDVLSDQPRAAPSFDPANVADMFGPVTDHGGADAALDAGVNDPITPTLDDIKRADRTAADPSRQLGSVTQPGTVYTEDDADPAATPAPANDSGMLDTVLLATLGLALIAFAALAARIILQRRAKAPNYENLPSRLLGDRRR